VVSEGRDFPPALCFCAVGYGSGLQPSGFGMFIRRASPLAGMDRAFGAWVAVLAFFPDWCCDGECQYGGFSTALRFGRNDSFWGGLRRTVELRSIPHPLQKAQRVGHPDCAASKYGDLSLRSG